MRKYICTKILMLVEAGKQGENIHEFQHPKAESGAVSSISF